uniref:Uncharacterized protein n=1 Tax=Siphoviridae sp. ctQqU1 TaxID=2825496 RepID=A0A8S5Q325_9CAUD|nr:MAG TPA: hypothetical protein [Siphoviridae sp. ctQqU1]
MISCAHNIAIIRTNLSNFCVILCINNLAHFKQALLEHLVFFLQRFNRLRQLVLRFLLFAFFFLRGQLFGGVADVSLHWHLLSPCGLRRHARHINDLPHIPAAVGVLRHRLVVAHFLYTFHSRVLHWFGVVHQIPKRQVRVFNGCTVLVNDLHGSKPPFSGHAPPDVHIVGGRLHGGAAAVDGIRLGRIQTELIYIRKVTVFARSCDLAAGSECARYLMFTLFYIRDKRACDVRQSGLHGGARCVAAASTHQHPVLRNLLPCTAKQGGRAGSADCLKNTAHGVGCQSAVRRKRSVRIDRQTAAHLHAAQRGGGGNGKLYVFQRIANSFCVSRSALDA